MEKKEEKEGEKGSFFRRRDLRCATRGKSDQSCPEKYEEICPWNFTPSGTGRSTRSFG
jgi:hypothetical protein